MSTDGRFPHPGASELKISNNITFLTTTIDHGDEPTVSISNTPPLFLFILLHLEVSTTFS